MPVLPRAVHRAAARLDQFHGLILLLVSPFLLFPSPARALALLALPALWLAGALAGRPLPPTPSTCRCC